jgi:DNA polymerase I-like protein with 3'-5' exonuclease and polymerase domains
MLTFDNGGRLITREDELPPVPERIERLYLDFETRSGDPKLDSLHPWHNCRPCGFAVTWDDVPGAWYVPVDHDFGPVVQREAAYTWLRDIMSRSHVWVNHNVKYDAHVYELNVGRIPPGVQLRCTVVRAKLVDSDRQFRGGYGLDVLSSQWLHEDISAVEQAMAPYLYRCKDYGVVPSDVMGSYGCQDVITNRRLDRYIDNAMASQCCEIALVEQSLTRVLLDVEQRGMMVDPTELKIAELRTMTQMLQLEAELEVLVGRSFRPHVNEDCYDVLCTQYGLPVMGWTDKTEDGEEGGNPSFDKQALAGYMVHPLAPKDVVSRIVKYRKLSTFKSLFVDVLSTEHVDGVIHTQYNQLVRTGRLSCKSPNMQQQDKSSKMLFHPRPGYSFMSCDYCLPAGTLIPTPYGDKPIEIVAANLMPVLSVTDSGELKFCATSRGGRVGFGQIFKITFTDGTTFECTSDHPMMRLDGTSVKCKDLVSGDRMAHVVDTTIGKYTYWKLKSSIYSKHKLVAEWATGSKIDSDLYHVHHIDEDKNNWCVSNLEVRGYSEHISGHSRQRYLSQDHVKRVEALREALKNRRSYAYDENPNWQGGKIVVACDTCDRPFEKWPSQDTKYCSKECRSAGRSASHQKRRVEVTCETCSRTFETLPGRPRVFCSRACSNRSPVKTAKDDKNYEVLSVEYARDDWYYSITVPETGTYVTTNGLINSQSQIEFRFIVHYIDEPHAVEAYNRDPDTDFHTWVAELCKIKRKPAKTVNFMVAFGGGKKKTIKTLSKNDDVIGDITQQVEKLIAEGRVDRADAKLVFDQLCERKAVDMYETYHATLPNLKRTSRRAASVCERRGYVYTIMGRHRHIPRDKAHIAFNTINQGSAADLMKERTVALAEAIRGRDIHIVASVHDEVLLEMPTAVAHDPRTARDLANLMEHPPFELRVPIRCSIGVSDHTWAQAGSDDVSGPVSYDPSECGLFDHVPNTSTH